MSGQASPTESPLRYRSPNWRAVPVVCGFTVVLFAALLVASFVSSKGGDANSQRFGLGIILLLAVVLFARVVRVQLVLDSRGVTIHNVVTTHQIAWSDVRRVVMVRRVSKSPAGAKVQTAKLVIVGLSPVVVTAGTAAYSTRAEVLKPVLDVVRAHGVEVLDA